MFLSNYLRSKKQYWKDKYNDASPWAISQLCIHILGNLARVVGVRVVFDCRLRLYSYMPACVAFQHFGLSAYSFIHFWKINKLRSLQAIPTLALSIPVRQIIP